MEEAESHNNPPKMHPCRFCDQVFVTAQALGGHQNCHRHERQLMKKAKEEEAERSSILAPSSPSKPLPPPPTMPASYNPNFSNHQNLFRDAPSRNFHRPNYAPNRMVPNEYYFQPFAQHHQQIPPIPMINNCYFGTRNNSNNMSETLIGNDAPFSRYHLDHFPSYYEGMPRLKRPRYESETYDFFANDGSGSSATQVVNQVNTIDGEKAKANDEGSVAGPSTELSMMHNGEKAADDNKDGNAQTGTTGTDELDLTLRL